MELSNQVSRHRIIVTELFELIKCQLKRYFLRFDR